MMQEEVFKIVLFTDLDGTVLDHRSYRPDSSLTALQRLVYVEIPVIFNSSKTFSESRKWQDRLGIKAPFIFENGSAIAIPSGYFPAPVPEASMFLAGYDLIVLAQCTRQYIRHILQNLFETSGRLITGFADVSPDSLADFTGLSGPDLQRANARLFTETLLTAFSEKEALELNKALHPYGLVASRGGRFYTVQSAKADKGLALRQLTGLLSRQFGTAVFSVAIGDHNNDLPMLEAADRAYLVQGPSGTWVNTNTPMKNLLWVNAVGPEGFSGAIEHLLSWTDARLPFKII
jgi:mannosyl-3-phosphoglycerate phosphatase